MSLGERQLLSARNIVQTFLPPADLALGDVVAALRSAEFDFGDERRATRVVLDTFDGRLHAAGLRLELRDGDRRELVLLGQQGSPPVSVAWPFQAPTTADELPAGPFGTRIAAVIGDRALVPVLELESFRSDAVYRDRRGKPIVTVTIHGDTTVASATGAPSLHLVEVDASLGHESAAGRAIHPLAALGLSPAPGDLVDAVVAITGTSLEGHRFEPMVPLHREDDAFDAFRAVLRNLLATAVDNLPGALADLDPEFLHDFRVALRRMRSVLRESADVLPSVARDRLRADLGDLATATSAARDLDVYALTWTDTIAAVGLDDPTDVAALHAELLARRERAHAALAKVLRSRGTKRLLDGCDAWLEDGALRPPDDADRPIGPYIAARIAKAQARVLRDGRLITPESPAARLHDLRKDAKRLRYLLECFGAVLPANGRKAFVAQLKELQDNLGLHQDAEVQTTVLRALAHDLHAENRIGPDTLLAVGRIIDHLERVRQREREAFAARFRAYDTAANRRLLDAVLAKAAQA